MRILLYGDSNTWGYDAIHVSRYENRYGQILQHMLPNDTIIESGLNGRTIALDDPFEPGRNGAKSIRSVIKTHMPIDLLVINLGINDAKRIYSTNEYSIEKGMRTLLNKVFQPRLLECGYAMPKILLVQPARMHPDYIKDHEKDICFGKEGYQMMEQAGTHLKKVAKEYGIFYVETPHLMAGAYDGIHMNEEGHILLAQILKRKIEELR
ncbi:MAG: GDSL-type esterase/lipase family protein [Absicoccus sp.]|uniref:GDSL-type esterase/lipase family protein n=1 Tax=Absicoccus intestinalis TaxID=2926319 RepID=A0ABU4WNR5_9FIRM|nr:MULTISPECIES: GDSL-type esterase/lipase family protein [unclassified Absicoccus]MDX8418204.1 GDSL-type esterase/lipase family protein [Absicoccus sp. CLA-KB-P134]MDY3035919.1 GDSL-type esterase/lipase family protein [Absicoccus sp.]